MSEWLYIIQSEIVSKHVRIEGYNMEFESEMSISTKILDSWRDSKIIEEQRLLERAWTLNLGEDIGIHTRQLERLDGATYQELFRWFIMDASEKYL